MIDLVGDAHDKTSPRSLEEAAAVFPLEQVARAHIQGEGGRTRSKTRHDADGPGHRRQPRNVFTASESEPRVKRGRSWTRCGMCLVLVSDHRREPPHPADRLDPAEALGEMFSSAGSDPAGYDGGDLPNQVRYRNASSHGSRGSGSATD
ncbi:hypothetical protein ABH920_006538 [Catenulispora sp. EB89]|uniref:hypothetical protein n=1 Tax=Catenulispora sp. EB89 TaxID=3156257 RepID=UPI00351648FE